MTEPTDKEVDAFLDEVSREFQVPKRMLRGECRPGPFDGSENDPLIKSGALKQWDDIETLNIPSRFSLFIPNELNVVEAAIFYLLETRGVRKEYEEIARCLQWEIRKEQETRKLTARKNGDIL